MSKPTSVLAFGTPVPSATIDRPRARHARFADIKTYASGAMPQVKVGQVYEDLDPRCVGRRVQVLKVGRDGKVLVRTLTPRTCAPRTPSSLPKDTTGTVSRIALRRFTENSRGFRLLKGSPLRSVQSYLLGARIAASCGIALSELEVRAADALIGLLGNQRAHDYLDLLSRAEGGVVELYLDGGISGLLGDAALFAEESELDRDWAKNEVASKSTARTLARLA